MSTSTSRETGPRHIVGGAGATARRPRAGLDVGSAPDAASSRIPVNREVWFWLRYPVFAVIVATFLELGTLAGAPLSSPLVPSDWLLPRWLIFFIAAILVAIPIFGSFDRGFGGRLVTWFVEGRGRNPLTLLATAAIAVAIGFLAAWVFGTTGLYAGSPDDTRPAAIFGILCAATAVLVVHHRVLFDHLEWGFLLVVLAMGCALQVALPPYTNLSADDRAHLNSAVGISYVLNPQVTPELETISDRTVGTSPWYPTVPAEGEVPQQDEALRTIFSWDAATGARDYLDGAGTGDAVELEGTASALGGDYVSLNTVGRIPMACGLWVGRLIGLPLSGQLIASRFSNLLFYAWIAWAAIRTIREGKLILATVALFPPIVMLAANLSYDPWIVSLVFLGVARFANVMQIDGAVLDVRTGLRILVPLFLGVVVKAVYFPILFLPMLAPRERYPSGARLGSVLWLSVGASLALVLLVGLPLVLSHGASNNDTRATSDVDSLGQIAYVLQHPLRTVRMYGAWFTQFWAPDLVPTGLFANYVTHRLSPTIAFGLEGGPFSTMATAFLFLAPFGLRREADDRYRTVKLIVGTAILTFLAISLMAMSLYVGFSPVASDTILGMQHRYAFPLLFPFLLFVPNAPIVNRISPRFLNGAILCVLALMLLGQSWWGCFSWLN